MTIAWNRPFGALLAAIIHAALFLAWLAREPAPRDAGPVVETGIVFMIRPGRWRRPPAAPRSGSYDAPKRAQRMSRRPHPRHAKHKGVAYARRPADEQFTQGGKQRITTCPR